MKRKIEFETDESREISPAKLITAMILILFSFFGMIGVILLLAKFFGVWALVIIIASIFLYAAWVGYNEFMRP